MPTCYMLIGLPGSGKSTISRDLIKEIPNLKIISTDEFIETYAQQNSKTYETAYQEYVDKAQKLMNIGIKNFISQKINFIWDQTNVYQSARKKKINMLHQNKYNVVGIALELSTEELEKRLNHRIINNGKRISIKTVMNLKKEYIPPQYEEGFTEIYFIKDDGVPSLLEKFSLNTNKSMKK